MIQKTFSIIKPDGVKRNLIGKIISLLEDGGLKIINVKMKQLTENEVKVFYSAHAEKHFFTDLVDYMISGPVLLMVLEGENAILKNREIMGATNPRQALNGTVRNLYASSIEENTIHGSDSFESASIEIDWFEKITS